MGLNLPVRRRFVRGSFCLLALAALTACGGSGSETQYPLASASTDPPSAKIQTSPALTPAFELGIHDYVVNCATTPQIQLSVVGPQSLEFTYLGTTSSPTVVRPTGVNQFTQGVGIVPGERFQFSIGESMYSVRCLPTDFPPLTVTRNGTPQAQWYVFAPTLSAVSSYVIIADSHGTPVWWMTEPTGEAINPTVLGPNEISWSIVTAEGVGSDYPIRNFSGQVVNTLTGLIDEHELQPTVNGTYIVIRTIMRQCPPDCADMSPWGGSAQTAALDAEILEIDANSNVLWTWRTRDHIGLNETGLAGWFPGVGNDIIHMNAVQIDGTDGLLFSARHLNAIYHITKSTGAIDWKMGGVPRAESLTVLGDRRPTATGLHLLSGQHDVRLWPDGTVSVHDNGTIANRPPFMVRYQLDTANKTAQVVQQIQDSRAPTASCCGSARLLPGGNWLVQWGANNFMTELSATGTPVLTIDYNMGIAFSYRALPVLTGVISADTLRLGMDAMATNGT